MLLLAQSLLGAAGFQYDDIQDAWVARMPLRPLVVVECDEDRAYIRESLMEVQATLDAIGCVYNNFVVNARFVSDAGSNADGRHSSIVSDRLAASSNHYRTSAVAIDVPALASRNCSLTATGPVGCLPVTTPLSA
jgi:hypothetical protein